jgi:hypothetical protein
MDGALPIRSLISSKAASDVLRPGSLVILKIDVKLSATEYSGHAGNSTFTVESTFPLSEGSEIAVRVTLRKGQLYLVPAKMNPDASPAGRVMAGKNAGSMPAPEHLAPSSLAPHGSHVPDMPPAFAALAARAVTLSDMEALRTALRLFSSLRNRSARSAEFVASLVDKGIDASASLVDEALDLLFASPVTDGKSGSGDPSRGRNGGADDGSGSTEEPSTPTDETALEEAIAQYAGTDPRPGSGAEALVCLFNHMRGRDGRWMYIPVKFTSERAAFKGVLRMFFSREEIPLFVSLDATDGSAIWRADFVERKGEGRELLVSCSDPVLAAIAELNMGNLSRALASSGVFPNPRVATASSASKGFSVGGDHASIDMLA